MTKENYKKDSPGTKLTRQQSFFKLGRRYRRRLIREKRCENWCTKLSRSRSFFQISSGRAPRKLSHCCPFLSRWMAWIHLPIVKWISKCVRRRDGNEMLIPSRWTQNFFHARYTDSTEEIPGISVAPFHFHYPATQESIVLLDDPLSDRIKINCCIVIMDSMVQNICQLKISWTLKKAK